MTDCYYCRERGIDCYCGTPLRKDENPASKPALPLADDECENCGEAYNQTACRWRCPQCGWKSNCCEGAPQ